MASNYPELPNKVKISITFTLKSEDEEEARDDSDWIAEAINTSIYNVGLGVEEVEVDSVEEPPLLRLKHR